MALFLIPHLAMNDQITEFLDTLEASLRETISEQIHAAMVGMMLTSDAEGSPGRKQELADVRARVRDRFDQRSFERDLAAAVRSRAALSG